MRTTLSLISLMLIAAISFAQTPQAPVKKQIIASEKPDSKKTSEKKAEAKKDAQCCTDKKDAKHECKGDCKDAKKEAKCCTDKKDAKHECKGDCKDAKKDTKKECKDAKKDNKECDGSCDASTCTGKMKENKETKTSALKTVKK